MNIFDSDYKEEHNIYYLLNKDIPVLKFEVVGSGMLETLNIIEDYHLLPYWIEDASAFIQRRRAPKKRENIAELLKLSGCDTLTGYFDIAHALSMIDTYWVKREDSHLTWEQMSLFTHQFNDVIAKTAFGGGLHGYNLETTSPEYGTDGTFAKCWIREDEQIKLLKRGSSGARNAGLEPYSEFYISQIAKELQLNNVQYGLRMRDDRICSVCNIFTSEQFGYVPYAAIGGKKTVTPIDSVRIMDEFNLKQEVCDMFVFDAVVFNEDRHMGNFGFIVDNDSQELQGMAPLFDHNLALLCYAEEDDFKNLDEYLKNKGPRIGDDFIMVARALLTPSMRKKLINLKGFEFEKHPKYNLPDWRLEELNKAVNKQIELILE